MRMSKMYWVKGKINNEDFSGRFDSKRKIVKTILDKLSLKDETSLKFEKANDEKNKWFIYLAEPKNGTYFVVTEMGTKPDNELKNSVNETENDAKFNNSLIIKITDTDNPSETICKVSIECNDNEFPKIRKNQDKIESALNSIWSKLYYDYIFSMHKL